MATFVKYFQFKGLEIDLIISKRQDFRYFSTQKSFDEFDTETKNYYL